MGVINTSTRQVELTVSHPVIGCRCATGRAGRWRCRGSSRSPAAARLEGLGWLAWSEHCLGSWADAARHASRAVEIARATGQQYLVAPLHIVDGLALLAGGNVGGAREAAETARESAQRCASDLLAAWAMTLECMVEMVDGSAWRAVALGEQAVTVARESRSPWAAVADCYLAEAYVHARRPEAASQQLLAGGQEPRLAPTVCPFQGSTSVGGRRSADADVRARRVGHVLAVSMKIGPLSSPVSES